jgi:hypothetical protein
MNVDFLINQKVTASSDQGSIVHMVAVVRRSYTRKQFCDLSRGIRFVFYPSPSRSRARAQSICICVSPKKTTVAQPVLAEYDAVVIAAAFFNRCNPELFSKYP